MQGLQLWLVIKVRYHYRCYVDFLSKYNCRAAALILKLWIHVSGIR